MNSNKLILLVILIASGAIAKGSDESSTGGSPDPRASSVTPTLGTPTTFTPTIAPREMVAHIDRAMELSASLGIRITREQAASMVERSLMTIIPK